MAVLDDFKPYISPEVPGVDVITLENHLRLAIGEFCDKAWVIQKTFTHMIDADDIDDELNDSVLITLPEYIKDLRPIWISRLRVDGVEWNVQYIDLVNDTSYLEEIREDGCKIFNFPTMTSLRVGPFTTDCELLFSVVCKPTIDATTFDDVLLYDYARGIAGGVKSELMSIPNHPWSNPERAAYYRMIFRKEIGEAKLKVSKDHSLKSKHAQPRTFGDWE